MVRPGRNGHGHYAHDGDYMVPCKVKEPAHKVRKALTDKELDDFIADADRLGSDTW